MYKVDTQNRPPKGSNPFAYVPHWLGGIACYAFFTLGVFLCSLFVIPLLLISSPSWATRNKRVQYLLHRLFQFFVALLTWTGGIRVKVSNLERLQQAKGAIVIANHPTLIDAVILISLIPNGVCFVKQKVWRNPLMGFVVWAAGYVALRNPERLLQDCDALLKQQTQLIIFPEGTRTKVGEKLNPFTRGAANIALRTQRDLIPVVIHTDGPGLSKSQPWYRIPNKRMGIHINIGEKIKSEHYCECSHDSSPISLARRARLLTRDLEHFYQQQLDRRL